MLTVYSNLLTIHFFALIKYVCNISNYTNRILETSTYLTEGISLPNVFPTLESEGHCPTKAEESYVATKNSMEKKRN